MYAAEKSVKGAENRSRTSHAHYIHTNEITNTCIATANTKKHEETAAPENCAIAIHADEGAVRGRVTQRSDVLHK